VKYWLVAYDICCHRRLCRVHKYMCGVGVPVQYSVFGVTANDERIRSILDDLHVMIDPNHDDVRAYHLPEHCRIWVLGNQGLPDGLILHASDAARLLCREPGLASRFGEKSPTDCASG
jgi:CRISPR-associated protein Cas2